MRRGMLVAVAVAVAAMAGCKREEAPTEDAAAKAAPVVDAGSKAEAETDGSGHPQVIGHGEEVDLEAHLAKGKWTVIDFYSDYCGPCRQIAPRLAELDQKRDDVVVVKVDINRPDHKGIDWDSPVARQFKLRSIPHFRLYDPKGKLDCEGAPAREKVGGWLNEL